MIKKLALLILLIAFADRGLLSAREHSFSSGSGIHLKLISAGLKRDKILHDAVSKDSSASTIRAKKIRTRKLAPIRKIVLQPGGYILLYRNKSTTRNGISSSPDRFRYHISWILNSFLELKHSALLL